MKIWGLINEQLPLGYLDTSFYDIPKKIYKKSIITHTKLEGKAKLFKRERNLWKTKWKQKKTKLKWKKKSLVQWTIATWQ